jgi:hypothetical protein
MRSTFKMAIVTVFMVLTVSLAQAQFMAGYELVQTWEAYSRIDEGKVREGDSGLGYLFMGYVTGVYDAIGYLLEPPSTVNIGQICSVVGKYLEAHPERCHEPAFGLVLSALLEAFPKRKKTT